jgi:3-dehydroquinate synthase
VANERVIPIRAGASHCEAVIAPGLIDRVGTRLAAGLFADRAAIVVDANVAVLHLERVRRSIAGAGGQEPIVVEIPPGEGHKSLATLSAIYDALLAAGIERNTPLLGVGGGMTTDVAGFAAATLLRGLPYFAIPTSLLAMVDAAIGGKTGINHAAGKNLIGAFHQPRAVLVDPEVLATLPARELRSGMAEVIKHYMIRDAEGFARLEARMPEVMRPDPALLAEIIAENIAIKAAVVEADPFERDVRAHLNFGHTFGHALEQASRYALSHGEAVALGMCAAMNAAEELGMIDAGPRERLRRLVAAAGLPTRTDQADPEAALAAMRADKKVVSGRLRFILPERIGSVTIRGDVPPEVVRGALASVCV